MGSRFERCTGRTRRAGRVTLGGRPGARLRASLSVLVLVSSAAIAVATSPPSAAAPLVSLDPFGRDRLLVELERTDQVLQRAGESLRDCSSPKANLLLVEGKKLQDEARTLYSTGSSTVPPARILLLTRRARSLAVDAIEQCQVEAGAHEELRVLLDTTSNLLQDARSAVEASGNAEAGRLLDAGLWQLDRAREAYRAGEYRRAILLGGAARNLVHRALDRVRGADEPSGAGARLDLALDRTDALLTELREMIGAGADVSAKALLEKAEREQEQARGLRERGAAAGALRRTQAARASALDALWLIQRAPDPDRLRDAANMVERLLAEASPEILGSGSAEAAELLAKAQDQLRTARAELAGGDIDRAAEAVRTADSLLRRAAEKAAR